MQRIHHLANSSRRLALLTVVAAMASPALAAEQDVSVWIQNYGLIISFMLVFASGILVSFTPCVYPMIPITLSIIGARSAEQKPIQGFMRSLVFVLGIAIIYSAVGFFGAKTGRVFGFVFQSKWFISALALFFIAMGISMMGFLEIQMPARFAGRLQSGANRGGYIGALLLGLVTGVVASPCGTPVLFSLLAIAAQSGTAMLAVSMLFVYALGIGLLFLVLGTFPAFLTRIPKSGVWMEDVRRLLGILLFIVAFYYLRLVFAPSFYWPLVLVGCLAAALLIAVRSGQRRAYPRLLATWRAAGVLFAVAAVYVAVAKVPEAFGGTSKTQLSPDMLVRRAKAEMMQMGNEQWITSEAEGIAEAKKSKRPIIIDFTADWCAACKELEHKTFSDPAVRTELARFVKIQIDCTADSDETRALQKKYGSKSLPTVAFVSKEGELLPDLSLYTFEPPQQFIERLEKVPQ